MTTSISSTTFQLVKFPAGTEDRIAIVQRNPADKDKAIVVGKSEAAALFKDAVDTANTLIESGKEANAKMVTDHPAVLKAKETGLTQGMNPQLRQAAISGEPIQDEQKTDQPKNYRYNREDIPDYVTSTVKGKLGEKAQVLPPMEGAKYKGQVVYEDKTYVVQGVFKKSQDGHGYSMQNAIAHKKADLEFVSDNHKWRADNRRLGGQELHVVYGKNNQQAKAYPYSLKKEVEVRLLKQKGIDVKALTPQTRESTLQSLGVNTPTIQQPAKQERQLAAPER